MTIIKQSRMAFLLIKLVIIGNNLCLMHHKYHEFCAVHVYLRSIRISLTETSFKIADLLFYEQRLQDRVNVNKN